MREPPLTNLPWFTELLELVRKNLAKLSEEQSQAAPNLSTEVERINSRISGWSESLANPELPTRLRSAIEVDWMAAIKRKDELEICMAERSGQAKQLGRTISPKDVLERFNRLPAILAANNPTLANLELSLHIDRIDCFPNGEVIMRTCQFGNLPEGAPLPTTDDSLDSPTQRHERLKKTRQRSRLCTVDAEDDQVDLRALADFAADPNRFAGLDAGWFVIDRFQIPPPSPSWAADNAEIVFHRRQEARLSYASLAAEFGVTPPTIGAAIRHYIKHHPGAKDVLLPRGGQRRKKIDIASFANEARLLWEAGWSKEKLAGKFGCSPPVINKAIAFSFEQAGQTLPMARDRKARPVN